MLFGNAIDKSYFSCELCKNYNLAFEKEVKDHLNEVHGISHETQNEWRNKGNLQLLMSRKIMCGSCEDKNDATHDCKECQLKICGPCVEAHQRIKSIRSHVITELPK